MSKRLQTSSNMSEDTLVNALLRCGFFIRKKGLAIGQAPQITGSIDSAATFFKLVVAGADADTAMSFAPYLKAGETPLQRLQREIKDSETLAAMLADERAKVATVAARPYLAKSAPLSQQAGDVGIGEQGETTSDYCAKRLRLIAEMLGIEKTIPEKNTDLWACAFSVLGMIRRELEKTLAQRAVIENDAALTRDAKRYRKARHGAYRLAVGNPTPEEFDAAVDSFVFAAELNDKGGAE